MYTTWHLIFSAPISSCVSSMAALDASFYNFRDQPMNSDLPISNSTTSTNVANKNSTGGPPPLKRAKRSNPEDNEVVISGVGNLPGTDIQLSQHDATLLAAGMDQSMFRNGTTWGISGFETGYMSMILC